MQQTINGASIHWREAGAGDAVLLVHGFPFDCTIFEPQLAAVPESWWYIAPDLRGFGASTAPGRGPLTMDVFADDLVALMDQLGIKQAVVCGLSMGGYVALSLARRYPDRVRALVFVATRAKADGPETRKNRLAMAARVRAEGAKPLVESMLPTLLSAHSRMKHPELVDNLRAMMGSTAPDTLARALEGMAQRKDYTNELSSIDVPTIAVRGEQDEIIPVPDMEMIARMVRGAHLESIALVAHLPNLEAPDFFNHALEKYLNYLPPMTKLGDISLSF
jgi:pimeloyl-ACP methyl ester carboxylesterase